MNRCYVQPKPVNPPKPSPDPKPYDGEYPTEAEIKQASNKGIHNNICTWCYDTWKSGKYGYITFDEQEQCPICHPRSTDLGWQCIGFDFASWRHGGGIPCNCWYGVLYNSLGDNYYYMSNLEILKSLQERIGVKDIQLIRYDNSPIPQSALEKGDLLMFYNGKSFCHMGVYIGDGKISDAANKADGIRYGASYSEFKCLIAIRYVGSHPYLGKGDEGTAVTKLQKYLLWFGLDLGKWGADGIWGDATEKAVGQLQKALGVTVDYLVGNDTLNAMKAYKK
jgi:peptidoglycan hydrolase-like protein with peptidoglycan-binding domain